MDTTAIYQRLTGVFHDVFDDDSIVVRPELTAKDIDEWDSLTHVRLIITVEKSFGVQFSASEVSRMNNAGDLASLIHSKLK